MRRRSSPFAALAVAALVAVLSGPARAAVVFVVDGEAGRVREIDAETGETLSGLDAGGAAGDPVVVPGGGRLVVPVADGVVVFETGPLRELRRIPLRIEPDLSGPSPPLVAVSPDGARCFALYRPAGSSLGGPARVETFDLDSGESLSALDLDEVVTSGLTPGPGGGRLLVAHAYYSGRVSVIELGRGRVAARLEVEDGCREVLASPDGRRLLVPNGGGSAGRLDVFDAETLARTGSVDLGGEPGRAVLAPDGTVLVALYADRALVTVDAGARSVLGRRELPGYPADLAVAGDRALVLLADGTLLRLPLGGDGAGGADAGEEAAPLELGDGATHLATEPAPPAPDARDPRLPEAGSSVLPALLAAAVAFVILAFLLRRAGRRRRE